MKTDVKHCNSLGCDGVVIGMLQADGSVDTVRCQQLVDLAYPLGVTFHRAFDRTNDPFKAMEDIISIGCERILTSGQKPTAFEATELIAQLIEQADSRIIIMPGSGVRSANIIELAEKTGATEFHTSARISTSSKMDFIMEAMQEDLSSVVTDGAEVRTIIQLLNTHQSSHEKSV